MIFKALIIAFSMYSKIPVPQIKWDEKSMKYALCFFPLIGVITGLVVYYLSAFFININMGKLLFGVIMSVIPVIINGGIHLDGFLDTIDGLASYGDKEKRLEILKDSNSGAFAIIWGIIYFALSIGLWSEIKADKIIFVCFSYVLSRALSGLSVINFKKAKKDGLANMFSKSAHKMIVSVALVLWIVVVMSLILLTSIKYFIVLSVVSILMFLYHYFNCIKNFGGITGDLAGFFLQIYEICILGIVVFI